MKKVIISNKWNKNCKNLFNLLFILIIECIILLSEVNAEVGMKLGKLSAIDIENKKEVYPMEKSKILNCEIEELSETYCTISWITETLSTVNIKYGSEIPPKNNIIILEADTSHKIKIDKLSSGTNYYYEIKGETEYSGNFKTLGVEPIKILNTEFYNIDKNSADIKIIFNILVKGEFIYWKYNEENNKKIKTFKDYNKILYVDLTDLEASSIYYYFIKVEDQFGRMLISDTEYFSTKENNIALNKSVEGTFTVKLPDMSGEEENISILNRVVDGSTNYFSGISTSENLSETDQWVILDLKEEYNIKLVILYWRKLCYPTRYNIEFSLDKINWNSVKTNINASTGIQQKADTGDPMLMVFTSGGGKNTRFMKITCFKDNYWVKHKDWNFVQLNEIKVYSN